VPEFVNYFTRIRTCPYFSSFRPEVSSIPDNDSYYVYRAVQSSLCTSARGNYITYHKDVKMVGNCSSSFLW
jgi:hypothetical protein